MSVTAASQSFLTALIEHYAEIRQIDTLVASLFTSLRSCKEFSASGLFLDPISVNRLCFHFGSMSTQIPVIWTLFLREWKESAYKYAVFLFLKLQSGIIDKQL